MANAASITGEEQRGLLQTVWCLVRGRAAKATATRVSSHWQLPRARNKGNQERHRLHRTIRGEAWDLRRAFCCSEQHVKTFYTKVSYRILAFGDVQDILSFCPLGGNNDIHLGLSQEYSFISKWSGLLKLQKKTRVLSSAKREEMTLFFSTV